MRIALLVGFCAMFFFACEKDPGPGGKAVISGHILVKEYNEANGQPKPAAPYYAAEERVYLIYGDNDFYDDDTRTDPTGLFKFQWLQKGDYEVFVYSDCFACPGKTEALRFTVPVDERDGTVQMPDITIKRLVD
jgi:hypothetical protein